MKQWLAIYLLCMFVLQVHVKAMETCKSSIPTVEEVLQSRHPLTLALYMARVNYDQQPVPPQVKDLKLFLCSHPLLESPWIHEKGFSRDIALAGKDVSNEKIEAIIEGNGAYKKIPELAQKLLRSNLLQAFQNYSRNIGK